MPRIRSIKPDFFTSEDVASLPYRARLTWIGLWTHVDDHGRAKDNPKLIRAAVWPLDDLTLDDVVDDLDQLVAAGRIVRYASDGSGFLAIVGWHDHQAINRPKDSRFPAPAPGTHPRVCSHGAITAPSVIQHPRVTPGGEGRGREQGGDARDFVTATTEPPLRCSRHVNTTDDKPCRPCGDARRAHDAWVRAQRARPTPVPGPGSAPRCSDHPQEAAHACRSCAADRKAAAS